MWSDNDIDNAFRRLDPAEPDPTSFPLDAWLKLEAGLDQAVIDRAVRRRLWQFFAAEVAVVALVGLGWSLWPAGEAVSTALKSQTVASASLPAGKSAATKRLEESGILRANGAGTPAKPPAASSLATITPRPAAGASTGAAASAEAPAATAATVATVATARAAVGRGPHLPLVARAASQHSTPTARSYSTDGRPAMAGNSPAVQIGATDDRSASTLANQKTTRKAGARSLTVAASAAEAKTSVVISGLSESGTGPETASRFASSPMADPDRAANEVAVAEAASHVLGASDAAPAARRSAAASESGTGSVTSSADTNTTLPETATASNLAPMAASVIAPARLAAEPLPTPLALTELTPEPLPAMVRQPRFYVGVVAAPDVSTVKFVDVQAPRLNVGLTLEYRLGQRWRLATGVQRSTKDYYARREDYDWTNYPRAQTRDFSWVEGECTVLDVPLNLRYDAVVQAHARWFGTAGLSSFFMQRENYRYDYLEGGTYKLWEMPGLVNTNRHLFSVLNLSAGYEYGLGTHWRLQAEPYVKVPLAGVGAGKVKLLSAGFYFGLKYGF